MKQRLLHLYTLILLSLAFTACMDDYFTGFSSEEGPVSMRLMLNLPGGGATTRTATDESEPGVAAEGKIDATDLHLLVFQDNKLVEEIQKISLGEEADGVRMLTATTEKSYKGEVYVVILTNMKGRGVSFNASIYLGQSKETIYKSLKYNYTGTWNPAAESEYIPMWGAFSLTPKAGVNDAQVALYRGVSKINITVNKGVGLDNFTLNSVRVYFANKQGYVAPLHDPIGTSVNEPSIGEGGFTQFDDKNPLTFQESAGAGMLALKEKIYVPESDNVNYRPLCLVVGGNYTGNGLVELGRNSYYRIDMKVNGKGEVFNLLRNFLYNININSVSNPGLPTPEDALKNAVVGMEVTIEPWNEISMKGISDQDRLVVNKSRISFPQAGEHADLTQEIEVMTTFDSWELDEPAEAEVMNSWFTTRIEGNKVIVTTTPNYSASREGYFYIKTGNLKKQILINQAQPETANCYILGGDGNYEISVVVKGNGTSGLKAESKDGSLKELDKSAILTPDHLGIIWETHAGLVQLYDGTSNRLAMRNVGYDTATGKLRFQVNMAGAAVDGKPGGNALIGAFDAAGTVIWSWHIWVCPEVNSSTYKDENWTLNGYEVMDRNLGALSNKPGVASLGLLYQWGRKDPFIGAGVIKHQFNPGETGVQATKNYTEEWGVQDKLAPRTITYATQHPTMLVHEGLSVTEKEKGPYLWGTDAGLDKAGVKELGKKTIYDPCPAGYRVPPVDAFVFDGSMTYENISMDDESFESTINKADIMEKTSATTIFVHEGYEPFNYTGVDLWAKREADADFIHYPNGVSFATGIKVWFYYTNGKKTSTYKLRKSSETKNWAENLVYIPENTHGKRINIEWADYLYYANATPNMNASYFGYYMNYAKVEIPKMKENSETELLDNNRTNITWIPLGGAYDPEKGVTFRDVTIEEGPSLSVNSFIWTNSSIQGAKSDSDPTLITRPGALFLHGANPKKPGDGRHIHGLIKGDIKAEPRYAGAVRCVRDKKKDFTSLNYAPETIEFAANGGIIEANLVSVNDTWSIVTPGAPWFSITPDRGIADKNRGQKIRFTAQKNTAGKDRSAIVKLLFSGEKEPRSIKVTQLSYRL